jgi:hypothetical protein
VDEHEYALQLAGLAAAFRDEAVQQAIGSGPRARIAVAMVVWADASTPKDDSRWHIISGKESAERFADMVERFPRRVEGGTGIGSAIAYAIRMMEWNEIDSPRRVVDVSGDGIETPMREDASILLPSARNMATSLGVVVNGLAISNEVHNLDDYYEANVISGTGAFVLKARSYDDFRTAIREKLLREIEARVASLP